MLERKAGREREKGRIVFEGREREEKGLSLPCMANNRLRARKAEDDGRARWEIGLGT